MTKRLNALEQRGLIRRLPHPDDGRSTTVSLTSEGKRLVDSILPHHSANERRLLGGLSRKERAELGRLLQRLAVTLGDVADGRDRGPARVERSQGARAVTKADIPESNLDPSDPPSIIALESPAAGPRAGTLIVRYGRGDEEPDVLTIVDALDPDRTLHGYTPAHCATARATP